MCIFVGRFKALRHKFYGSETSQILRKSSCLYSVSRDTIYYEKAFIIFLINVLIYKWLAFIREHIFFSATQIVEGVSYESVVFSNTVIKALSETWNFFHWDKQSRSND